MNGTADVPDRFRRCTTPSRGLSPESGRQEDAKTSLEIKPETGEIEAFGEVFYVHINQEPIGLVVYRSLLSF